jgi:hypothetical protein
MLHLAVTYPMEWPNFKMLWFSRKVFRWQACEAFMIKVSKLILYRDDYAMNKPRRFEPIRGSTRGSQLKKGPSPIYHYVASKKRLRFRSLHLITTSIWSNHLRRVTPVRASSATRPPFSSSASSLLVSMNALLQRSAKAKHMAAPRTPPPRLHLERNESWMTNERWVCCSSNLLRQSTWLQPSCLCFGCI